MLISKCHLMGPFRAFLKPMSPGVIMPPAPSPLGGPALQYTLVCTGEFTVPVQVFFYFYCPSTSLPCVTTVTGLAVLYVPVAGYRYHTNSKIGLITLKQKH